MFKKLIERIDAVSDYVNPIVVRNMRRALGRGQMNWVLMIYACLLVVGCVLVYFLCDLDSLELHIYTSDFASYIFWAFIWHSILCSVGLVCFAPFSQNIDDEMFLITPITPRQYLHASMIETFIWTFLGISLFVPVVFIIFWQSPNFLVWATIMLFDGVLMGQIVTLVVLPFFVRVKNIRQMFYTSICFCIFGWAFTFFIMPLEFNLVNLVLTNTTSKLLLVIDGLVLWQIIFFCIFVPIGSLLTMIPAYRLSLYALRTRKKSIVRMFLLNVFCIILTNVVVTLICSGVTFVVFRFL
jgi:hypothetical protein